jgi:hypothetical protein
MTSASFDPDEPQAAEDLTVYITDDPDDWNEFWDSEPFEKWRRGGDKWR